MDHDPPHRYTEYRSTNDRMHEYGYRDQPGLPRCDGNVWAVRIGFFIGIATLLWILYELTVPVPAHPDIFGH